MPEVREQTAYAATLRVQRGKILKRVCLFRRELRFRQLRLHSQFVRLPLKFGQRIFLTGRKEVSGAAPFAGFKGCGFKSQNNRTYWV
jgi:hypothetical protein